MLNYPKLVSYTHVTISVHIVVTMSDRRWVPSDRLIGLDVNCQ